MSIVIRFFCEECKTESRGVSNSLPVQIILPGAPHKKGCLAEENLRGASWIQVYAGEYEDTPPLTRKEEATT
jgi:hypothetical protein